MLPLPPVVGAGIVCDWVVEPCCDDMAGSLCVCIDGSVAVEDGGVDIDGSLGVVVVVSVGGAVWSCGIVALPSVGVVCAMAGTAMNAAAANRIDFMRTLLPNIGRVKDTRLGERAIGRKGPLLR
jgi:hypothetical protein